MHSTCEQTLQIAHTHLWTSACLSTFFLSIATYQGYFVVIHNCLGCFGAFIHHKIIHKATSLFIEKKRKSVHKSY
jgi:hypothetical protein